MDSSPNKKILDIPCTVKDEDFLRRRVSKRLNKLKYLIYNVFYRLVISAVALPHSQFYKLTRFYWFDYNFTSQFRIRIKPILTNF